MFNRKVVATLSPESLEALHALNGDMQVLHELTGEIARTLDSIRSLVLGDLQQTLATETGAEYVEVKVFDDKKIEDETAKQRKERPRKQLPEQMQPRTRTWVSSTPEEDRIRETPFNRAPRHVQVKWILDVMADGEWYTASWFADTYANEPSHHRYIRAVLNHRLRELHEEGVLERRSTKVKGAMHEYRIHRPVAQEVSKS